MLKFDTQGHRGCRGLMPENTIPAFKKAIELGVTTLEMDAVITKDKKVILSHEPFFNHEITTQANGHFINENEERSFNIYEMNYQQTTPFDVGLKPHPRFPHQQKIKVQKPLLADVIDFAEGYTKELSLAAVQYNIETKCLPTTDNIFHPEPHEFVDLLMSVILDKKMEERVVIQSFDIRTLQYLHKKYPVIKTSYLFEPPSDKSLQEQLDDLGFIPTIYSPDYETVNEELVSQCKKLGMQLLPWTVNDIETIQKFKNMGVDGVISDYPDLFQQLK
jgi:glycerophosphoryl diester phosphodiesterase